MNWEKLFSERHRWLDVGGASSDVVISSRVRLARNVINLPFPARLSKKGQRELVEKVSMEAQRTKSLAGSDFLDLGLLKKHERQFLMERHLISPEMAFDEAERGVLIQNGQRMTLMINEEDHVRLQSFEAGLGLRQAWVRADKADSELGERLPFAFDSEWGFCTRCPTNVGTGMRASCLLHVPALVLTGDIQRVLESLPAVGVTARGFYGERSTPVGDLFQISNATSLGHSEAELLESVERVVQTVAHHERQAREALLDPDHRAATQDLVYRAWGILRNARLISYDEAMSLLSRVRLGLQVGMPLPVQPSLLNQLMLVTQPAHLQLLKGGTMKAEERDVWRAAMIRRKLGEPDDTPS